ncbi:head HK97 family portal protein [Brucella endophytica]|uniref:Head HK97 family portal protein n=1 Tax=Brucella endophytica TaxID=1963359 RepID=A0A916S398_9HYPH|nr:phage portal protein [Brucella endophytica]GGA81275.1 head HK97 family portal protein [Brucella endophytica]
MSELFTGSIAGIPLVSAATALTVPAVSAAIRVISEAVATLEIKVVHVGADGKEEADTSHPAYALLSGQANDWLSGFDLIRDLVAEALCHDAGGFAWVNRVGGRPFEIIHYDPGNIGVQYSPQGTGEPTYRLNSRVIKSDDVIHLRGAFSRSPLTLARQAITAAHVMESYAVNLFANGARPSGILKTKKPLGDEGVKRMIAGWKKAHEGGGKSGGTAVLYDETDWSPITLTSTDAQFLELRRFQIEEIARAFNIPAPMIGDLTRATWSNSEQKAKEFLSYTLEPWIRALEAALNRALFSKEERKNWKVEFDRDDLTRADLAQRATAYSSLISARVINPNEAREWEGLPPYAEGDTFANPNTGASQPGSPSAEENSETGKNPDDLRPPKLGSTTEHDNGSE